MIWIVGIAVVCALVAAVAYGVACYLTGENLAAVLWDEVRLSRLPLHTLDEACHARALAGEPDSGLVVSLTTIPSRLEALQPTLKSLLRQTSRPREIRLCLPAWSLRENRPYVVPAWLAGLRCVTLVTVEDSGPATKFLATLGAVAPDQPVVVLDDDRVYHPHLLAQYAALAGAHPDVAIAGAGWRVPSDRIDRPTTLRARLAGAPYVPRRANQLHRPERTDILQGVHSYLVRPRFFDLAALGDFSGAPPALRFVDDVWVSAHCRAEKWLFPMPLAYIDYQPLAQRRLFRRTALGANVNRASDHAQRGNSLALSHFDSLWRT